MENMNCLDARQNFLFELHAEMGSLGATIYDSNLNSFLDNQKDNSTVLIEEITEYCQTIKEKLPIFLDIVENFKKIENPSEESYLTLNSVFYLILEPVSHINELAPLYGSHHQKSDISTEDESFLERFKEITGDTFYSVMLIAELVDQSFGDEINCSESEKNNINPTENDGIIGLQKENETLQNELSSLKKDIESNTNKINFGIAILAIPILRFVVNKINNSLKKRREQPVNSLGENNNEFEMGSLASELATVPVRHEYQSLSGEEAAATKQTQQISIV
jgi:hypothetical protein